MIAWLGVDATEFYERLLPLLLCRLPLLSAYDRCCESCPCGPINDSEDEDNYDDRSGYFVRGIDPFREERNRGLRPSRIGGFTCVCKQMGDYRAALTSATLCVLLGRLIFDMRNNVTALVRHMSRDRAKCLFERLMTNGFACVALPFSYFVDDTTVFARCRELKERVSASPFVPRFQSSQNFCVCHSDALRVSLAAIDHMIYVRRTTAPDSKVAGAIAEIRDKVFASTTTSHQRISLTASALRVIVLTRGLAETLKFTSSYNLPYDKVNGRLEAYLVMTIMHFLRPKFWRTIVQRPYSDDFVNRFWMSLRRCASLSLTAAILHRPFPIAHTRDSPTYDAASHYAREGQLDVAEANVLMEAYDDRRNFALLAALTPTTVAEYYRDVATGDDGGLFRSRIDFSTLYATKLYTMRTSSRLERQMLELWCDKSDNDKDDDDDDDDATADTIDNNDSFLSGGSVLPNDEDSSSLLSSSSSFSPPHRRSVLHRNAVALPEFLHENHAWLWTSENGMKSTDFARWFCFARRRMRRVSALETDDSRVSTSRFPSANTLEANPDYRCDFSSNETTMRLWKMRRLRKMQKPRGQRRALALSFWHAAHNTVAFVVITYARLCRAPTEAVVLFRDLDRWTFWYSPPSNFRASSESYYERCDNERCDCGQCDDNLTRMCRTSLSELGRGLRSDPWSLALAALFVRPRTLWRAVARFMNVAIGEFEIVHHHARKSPLHGYSTLDDDYLVWLEAHASWLGNLNDRGDHEFCEIEYDESDDDTISDDVQDDDTDEMDDRVEDEDDEEDDEDEAMMEYRSVRTMIDQWTRDNFVSESRCCGDSVAMRALDCIFVLRGAYRTIEVEYAIAADNNDWAKMTKRRIVLLPTDAPTFEDRYREIILPDDETESDDKWWCDIAARKAEEYEARKKDKKTRSASIEHTRFCCNAYRDAWNERLAELADARTAALGQLYSEAGPSFAEIVRRDGITAALASSIESHSSDDRQLLEEQCRRYFERVFWCFITATLDFSHDLCIHCYL